MLKDNPDSDFVELKAAKEKAKKRMQEDGSAENVEEFVRISKEVDKYVATKKEPVFQNRDKVFEYLRREGYSIGKKSAAYNKAKKHKLKIQGDGTILESDVDRFIINAGLLKPEKIGEEIEISGLNKRKLEAQILKSEKLGKLYGLKCEYQSGISIKRAE